MKKRRNREDKQKKKGFGNSPFRELKGLSVETDRPRTDAPIEPERDEETMECDDEDIFLQQMAGIKRLDGSEGKGSPSASRGRKTERSREEEERRLFLSSLAGMDVTFRDEFPYENPVRPLAANRMRQVRTGTIRINLELDLHGLTKDEALQGLNNFITGAYNRGQRAVLVITGKGNNSPAEPVLRGAVTSWLRERSGNMVAEFAPAPRKMGGSGAFVVFLKEKREEKHSEG